MTEQEFLDKMIEILDTESELSLNTAIEDIEEWDSLAFIAVITMVKEYGFAKINSASVNKVKTVGDLFELTK